MTYLFTRTNQQLLERFAASKVLLAFDFDGTLAPIVGTPDRAAMRAATRRLLIHASELYPCSIVSGRSRADVADKIRGVDISSIVGNHGAEPRHGGDHLRRRVRRWLPALRSALSTLKGVVIENKRFSIAIHYRHTRRRNAALEAILLAAGNLPGVRIVGGTLVVNVIPAGTPHKGVAVEHERSRLGCERVIFIGDDETDEDVFRDHRPKRLLAIRIGRRLSSAAPYYLKHQREIDRLLDTLVTLRSGPARAPRAS